MSYLAIFMSVSMMAVGGLGIDLMMSEMRRAKMQHTLDRAVLAAADLDQVLDPTLVVTDYFNKSMVGEYLTGVTVDEGLNYRTVSATAQSDSPSNFVSLIGIDTLRANAAGAASERIQKVEISMVLDISGSMAYDSKLQYLKNAAKEFVGAVLSPSSNDLVSVSLVPYSEHVNAGRDIFDEMNVNQVHNYSYCIEFPDSEFGTTALDTTTQFEQMQHFQWNYDGSNDRSDTVCPRYSYEEITPMSRDAAALNSQIDQFQPRAGTSIFMGMKWASALLDPSFRPVAADLMSHNKIDGVFSGRPVDYDDPETLKTVVLMTDGQHDRSNRISDWAYNSNSEISQWNRYNLWYYLYRQVDPSQRNYFWYEKYDAAKGDALLDNICDAAKAQGVIVWGIGFEVTDHGAAVMENCASSPAHFFRVEGVEISDAFSSIARTISQLRLIQ